MQTSTKEKLAYSFMAEFARSSAEDTRNLDRLGLRVTGAVIALAILCTIAGAVGRMNVLSLSFTAATTPLLKSCPQIIAHPDTVVFGYWGMLTWGFFHIAALPVATWLVFAFARMAGGAISELHTKGRLKPLAESTGVEALSQSLWFLNRRFRMELLLSMMCFSALCFFVQHGAYVHARETAKQTGRPGEWNYGQTQAPFLNQLQQVYDQAGMKDRLTFIKTIKRVGFVSEKFHAAVRYAGQQTNDAFRPYLIKSETGEITGLDLESMVNNGLVSISLEHRGGPAPGNRFEWSGYLCCVIIEQFLTAYGWTLALWAIVKFVFWVREIRQMLRGTDSRNGFYFDLLMIDPQRRLGLGALHGPYNVFVTALALYGLYFALSLDPVPGMAALTANAQGGEAGTEVSRYGNIMAIASVIIVLVIGPITNFAMLVRGRRDKELETIATELGRCAGDADAQAKLLARESLVSEQMTWPQNDKGFRAALAAVIAFIIIPIADRIDFMPKEISEFINIPQKLTKVVQRYLGEPSGAATTDHKQTH